MYPKWKIMIVVLMAASILLSSCATKTPTPVPATATSAPVSTPTEAVPPTAAVPPKGDVLTVAVVGAPPSLDPGTTDAAFEPFITLAYSALLGLDPTTGKILPGLAVTWQWVGTDYKTFTMELRPNVVFSDGTAFDAAAVKGWLELQKANGSGTSTQIGLDNAEVTGPLSITLHLAQPKSLLPILLTRNWISGAIGCPAAVTNPDLVKTATCGAGPYMLDTANTVTNDTYTYIPNPHYWNPDGVHWNKIVLKVIASPQSALDALQTGQVQLITPADASIVSAATTAGMTVTGIEYNVQGLDFLFKDGTVVPALGDVRVRQALNYAIDRTALAKVLNQGMGRGVSSEFLPGSDAYDASMDNYYPYDVAKAKTLLAAAGYADGFDVTILSLGALGFDTLAQAVASYWEAIGVHTTVDNKTSASDYVGSTLSGQYAVNVAGLGVVQPLLVLWAGCFAPGSFWNQDKTVAPEVQSIVDQLASTDLANMAPIAKQFNDYITENAWYVPVVSTKLYFIYGPGVTGGVPTSSDPLLQLLDVVPSK